MSRRDRIYSLLGKSYEELNRIMADAMKGRMPDIERVYKVYVDLEYSVFLIKVEGRLEGFTETRVNDGMKLIELLAISLDAIDNARDMLRKGRLLPVLKEARIARDGVREVYLQLKRVKGRTVSVSSERSLSPVESPSSESRANIRP